MTTKETSAVDRLLAECANAELAEGRCTIDDVVARAWRLHGKELEHELKNLAWERARDRVKKLLRDLADDDEPGGQIRLPGLHLPTAIAVRPPDEGEIYYVRADKAVWPELLAGLQEREQNIARAIAKRDLYLESLDRLRPLMEHDHAVTVTDALRSEAAEPIPVSP